MQRKPCSIFFVLLCLAFCKLCLADYRVLFRFSLFVNEHGLIKGASRRCDSDSDCDTQLAVCVSASKTNCSNYQFTQTFSDSNSVFFNDDLNDSTGVYSFCELGSLPNVIFVYVRALDVDGNGANESEGDVILDGFQNISTTSLNDRDWTQFGNSKSSKPLRMSVYLKVERVAVSCKLLPTLSLRTSNTPFATSASPQQPQNDGLVLPWWVVTGSIGALVGGFVVAVAVAAVFWKKRLRRNVAQVSYNNGHDHDHDYDHETRDLNRAGAEIGVEIGIVKPQVKFDRELSYDSILSCRSNEYETLGHGNSKKSLEKVDEHEYESPMTIQSESPYQVPCSLSNSSSPSDEAQEA